MTREASQIGPPSRLPGGLSRAGRIFLLGPQRLRPTVGPLAASLGVEGVIATVTAGWQEREAEDDELREHLVLRTVNLRLHRRSDEVFAADPPLFAAHRARQERLRRLQELYRIRLGPAIETVRRLLAREGEGDLVDRELGEAMEVVRGIDARQREKIAALHREFEETHRPAERRAVAAQRRDLARILAGCAALAVAGGHIPVLLNRMRLFDLLGLLDGQIVFAWSAGAMVLAEQVVVFHDSPPQGAGHAEVLEAGLGVYRGILPLPHARRRLRLEDPLRVALFARRFARFRCLVMDEGAQLACEDGRCRWQRDVRLLTPGGEVVPLDGGLEAAPA